MRSCQRRDLLGQVLRRTATRPILLGIGPVQAAQIVGQTLVRRADHLHQLVAGEVAVGAIDRFQPGPVDGKQFSSEQLQFAAEEHELTEDRLEGVSVVLAKIRNGLEVGSQATQQPDHFQIARGLRLEPPAGAHPIDVSINVELQQIGRIVARPAGVLRLNAPETGFLQITLINERLNETHRIFSTDVIINCYRQKQSLVAVAALYMLHAPI